MDMEVAQNTLTDFFCFIFLSGSLRPEQFDISNIGFPLRFRIIQAAAACDRICRPFWRLKRENMKFLVVFFVFRTRNLSKTSRNRQFRVNHAGFRCAIKSSFELLTMGCEFLSHSIYLSGPTEPDMNMYMINWIFFDYRINQFPVHLTWSRSSDKSDFYFSSLNFFLRTGVAFGCFLYRFPDWIECVWAKEEGGALRSVAMTSEVLSGSGEMSSRGGHDCNRKAEDRPLRRVAEVTRQNDSVRISRCIAL